MRCGPYLGARRFIFGYPCAIFAPGYPYFRTASLKALAAHSRTTVLALILIASPVAGLRPMRALRCAFTARPKPGMTNLPVDFASFTASLKSSSKNKETVFLGSSTFSARCATIFDLLSGFAIELCFLLRSGLIQYPGAAEIRKDYSRPFINAQEKMRKKPIKRGFLKRGEISRTSRYARAN